MTIYTALAEGEFSLKESITLSCRLAKKLDTKLIGVSAMPDPARAVIMTGVSMHGVMFASGGSLLEGIREAQKEARELFERANEIREQLISTYLLDVFHLRRCELPLFEGHNRQFFQEASLHYFHRIPSLEQVAS